MRWVIDASVAVKWLSPEADRQADRLLGDELLVPDLLFAEVSNVLWKKQIRREMDAATVGTAARWLLQLPLHVYDCAAFMIDALALSVRLQHPAYDCFYLALSRRADCPLVTADRRLSDRCRRPDAAGLVGAIVLLSEIGASTDRP